MPARSTGSSRREPTGPSASRRGSPSGSACPIRSTARRRSSRRRRPGSASASRPRACRSRASSRRAIPGDPVPLCRQGPGPAGPARPHARAGAARSSRAAVAAAACGVARRRRARRGAHRRPGADGERDFDRRPLRPAHGHRPAPGRPACLRCRARARLAERSIPTDAVVEAARQPAHALGIENGPTYTQIRLGPDGPAYVIEVAARLGGGHDAELCSAALGVDLADLARLVRARRARSLVTHRHKARLVPPAVRASSSSSRPEGVLRAAEGSTRPRRSKGVEWVRIYRRAGWRVRPAPPRRRPRGCDPGDGAQPRRRARPGSPCGTGRTLPGRCGPVVAPGSASSLPQSARRRSRRSPRRCARAGSRPARGRRCSRSGWPPTSRRSTSSPSRPAPPRSTWRCSPSASGRETR